MNATTRNNNQFSYSTPRFQHYYPWSLGLSSFLKPSQLPGSIQPRATNMRYMAKSITITNSALTGTHFTPGWREAIIVKCLARVSNPHSAAPELGFLIHSVRHPVSTQAYGPGVDFTKS